MSTKPEFSRPLAVEGVTPDKTRREAISATPEECAALAQRLDLRSLSGLKADMTVRRVAGGDTVQVTGDFEAEAVQACGVTLRDVPAMIRGSFETYFSEKAKPDAELSADDTLDSEEAIVNGMIDLGETVTQYLSLELPAYPRAPGVNLPAQSAENTPPRTEKPNPFAALAKLKKGAEGEK